MPAKSSPPSFPLLIETAWEVCNQVGGIYTVIRSKVPAMMEKWGTRYVLVGPYLNPQVQAELELLEDQADVFGQTAMHLKAQGYEVYYASWLVTGKPRVILMNPASLPEKRLKEFKILLWEKYGIPSPPKHDLIDQVLSFAYLNTLFFEALEKISGKEHRLLGHFHEWMAGIPILEIKRKRIKIPTLFTTHATQLGRYLAIHSPLFYDHLPFFNREEEAKKFGIETEEKIEFSCATTADLLSTVSEVTARECKHLLKRRPEYIFPNGLNIERFEVHHEFQNLHNTYKQKIHHFVMGHFFPAQPFDLEKTLYFFTSGRYEYKNKGFDLTLEALYRLNQKLKNEKSEITVVMFFVTRKEFYSIRPQVLHSKAMMEEIRQTVDAIQQQVGTKLFLESASLEGQHLPDLNTFVDEYWKLRYRRTLQAWKNENNPMVVTHKLVDEEHDEILNFLNKKNLLNHKEDRVKIVYHPDFINSTNPLFSMDYNQFVRGCHLGIFPSYYEPWGYTPLECMASGVPSITSDLSGFGDYVLHHVKDHPESGLSVIERGKRDFNWSAEQLCEVFIKFIQQNRSERIVQRNLVENRSHQFDWSKFIRYYEKAYQSLLKL